MMIRFCLPILVVLASLQVQPAAAQEITGDPAASDGVGISGDSLIGFSRKQLQHRAALIQIQHVAVSLIQARERGITPAEQGYDAGSVVARYREPMLWHRSSEQLHLDVLARLLDDDFRLGFDRASFTLKSRYEPVEDALASYESSIQDYVEWLEGLHGAIGPDQGYAMTAEIAGEWLVETYRDLPPRYDRLASPDFKELDLSSADRARYIGTYVGSPDSGEVRTDWVLEVWEEAERLRVVWYPEGGRAGHGGYLIPVDPGGFVPGWYPEEGPPEIDPYQGVEFALEGEGPAEQVELEVLEDDEVVVYRLQRVAATREPEQE